MKYNITMDGHLIIKSIQKDEKNDILPTVHFFHLYFIYV